MSAQDLLAQLEALTEEQLHFEEKRQAEKDAILTPEQKQRIAEIERQYQQELNVAELHRNVDMREVIFPQDIEKQAEVDKKFAARNLELNLLVADTEKKLREEVIKLGESVKGTSLHAVFSKGTAKWDNKKLEGFALVHPEVMNCREPLVPTVTLRKITKKD